MSAFTPGPWIAIEREDDDVILITTNDRIYRSIGHIAKIMVGFNEPIESEQRADAALIAAAPEMLSELLSMRQCYHRALIELGWTEGRILLCMTSVDAVIARAEGRAP